MRRCSPFANWLIFIALENAFLAAGETINSLRGNRRGVREPAQVGISSNTAVQVLGLCYKKLFPVWIALHLLSELRSDGFRIRIQAPAEVKRRRFRSGCRI